ncbi:hypothetical protein ANCCAN_09497 [Ancylostoma caninum]|uniref:Uncharacterized protein n=1 Tax=Ancylostoma caninum TaxID=29170 RepID=A0A368GJF3_ANCCA|nr:hypothetical protein ANCCAN_09497 [Ancylostoma caninum]
MRGRTVPIVNSASLQSASSYVQINIYDTNLKALRKRGVDVKHFLQHVGCRSVVMDVPIVSSEVKRPSRFASRRLNKSFGGFTVQAEDSLLKEEITTTKTSFCEPVVDEGVRGPLTSTPMVAKSAGSFRSFLSARGTLDDTCINDVCDGSDTDLLNVDNYAQQPSERPAVQSAAAESLFAALGAPLMKDVKCMSGEGTSFSGIASSRARAVDSAGDEYPTEGGDAEFCDSVNKEAECGYAHSRGLLDNLDVSGTRTADKASSHVFTTAAAIPELHTSNAAKSSTSATERDDSTVKETLVIRETGTTKEVKEPRTVSSKNSSSSNQKINRRKRMRPPSPQEFTSTKNGGSCETVEGCTDKVTPSLLFIE